MSFEKPKQYITPAERQNYLLRLQVFIQNVMPAGAVSDETEAARLLLRLQQNEPIEKEYVERILSQLGDSDDRGSLYH
jgi:hypothetical protein